jgi:hypothetical protein
MDRKPVVHSVYKYLEFTSEFQTSEARYEAGFILSIRIYQEQQSDNRGSTVVKVLRYKSEGRWFDPRWCH